MPVSAIEVKNLTKEFYVRAGGFRSRKVTALDDVSFSIGTGEAFGLLGANGSGKSTLLRILSTVLLPTSGQAWVAGRPISQVKAVQSLVGVAPPDSKGFHGFLSGRQNLEFFAVLHRVEPKRVSSRVEELLQRLGIADLGKRPIWTYSTGQRQRLNLARAMLHDPPVYFLDEPTKGLDPWGAEEIRGWIRRELIGRRRKTLLVASNQKEELKELCDGLLFLRAGRLIWQGPANHG